MHAKALAGFAGAFRATLILKQPVERTNGKARPLIGDVDAQAPRRAKAHIHADPALIGILDRVRQDVRQDPVQRYPVDSQDLWQVRVPVTGQRQPLGRGPPGPAHLDVVKEAVKLDIRRCPWKGRVFPEEDDHRLFQKAGERFA